MCIFVGPVEHVSKTRIFARPLHPGRQLLIYEMTYAASGALAMVLPVPTAPGGAEDALRFVSLEGCAEFFVELRRGFSAEDYEGAMVGALVTAAEATTLEVHRVGAFEASFVPRAEDFGRLDERFRLPAEFWLTLSHYRDWGFAVFKLRETRRAEAHPMAFTFASRAPDRLFFPTVHVHRGRVERRAEFDHSLYCQPAPAMNWHLHQWRESTGPVADFLTCALAAQITVPEQPCWRADMVGMRENRDTWLGAGETLPA